MGDDDSGMRDDSLDQFSDRDNRFDAIVYEKDLPLPLQFLLDCGPDDIFRAARSSAPTPSARRSACRCAPSAR